MRPCHSPSSPFTLLELLAGAVSGSDRKVQGFLGKSREGALPACGLFLSSPVFQDPKPREAAEHRATISMATVRQEMGGDGGTSASQSLQGRRVRDRQVVPVIQETWAPAMQMRLVKRPSIMSGDKKPGVCSGAASSRAAATLNTSLL